MSALFDCEARPRPGRGASEPSQRPRRRDHPARSTARPDGPRCDRAARSAARSGLDRGQLDQRQDDHRRDDRRDPARRRARARPQPGRLEHALGRRHGPARAIRATRGCSSSTRRGCPAWRPSCRPRLLVLGNLFRDQLDRYGELERLADEWAELVARLEGSCGFALNADDPLIADLGRDRGAASQAGSHLLRDRGREPGAPRAPARPRRQALPPLRRPLRLRPGVRRPPRPLHLPQLRRRPAQRPTSRQPRSSSAGISGSRVHVDDAGG